MAKTIFLRVKKDLVLPEVIERSFHVENCALLRFEDTDKKKYVPMIIDFQANEKFLVFEATTKEDWEALKKLFAE